nr:DUF3368 domain-containing protein [Candidatus Sigynarchaeota archaeon]
MTSMKAIINSSPLMYLGKLGLLQHLPALFTSIMTCPKVKAEIMGDTTAPEHATLDIAFSTWLLVEAPKDRSLVEKLMGLNIHAGEAGIIALAMEYGDDEVVIIDDLAARDIAGTFGLTVTGTVGILLLLAKRNILDQDEAKGKVMDLVNKTTFRMSTTLYSRVLEKIDAERKECQVLKNEAGE